MGADTLQFGRNRKKEINKIQEPTFTLKTYTI